MLEAFKLHTITHLRFFVRSRVILGLTVVLGVLWGLGTVAFVLMESSSDRFDMLKTISGQLRSFAWMYTAGMGLFAYWWHTTQRTTTLIFTRQGAPEIWLSSIFGSAFLAAILIHTVGFVLTLGLSLAWGVPWQTGFVWLTADAMLESIIMVSVLTGLAAALHPVLALLVMLFFTESTFYFVDLMLLGYIEANGRSVTVGAIEHAVRAVHALLPMLDPFATRTADVESTLRVAGRDWLYLAGTSAYALLVFAFWFLFADYRLRKRILN